MIVKLSPEMLIWKILLKFKVFEFITEICRGEMSISKNAK